MKQLRFNLKKKWYDMIRSGGKKEEYREIKPFYISQLFDWKHLDLDRQSFADILKKDPSTRLWIFLKQFRSTIIFDNGYSKIRPSFEIVIRGVEIGTGKPEWGAEPGKLYFVFLLGDVING